MIQKCLLALTFCFHFLFAYNQSYTFSSYSIAEGLAQSQVTTVTEDKNGYLWVGTLGGLSCFNGNTFRNYSAQDGLLNNRITALCPEGDKLWIGHENGISLYYKRQFKHWTLPNKKNNTSVSNILTFQGQLIVSTNGGGLYIFKDNHLEALPYFEGDRARIRHISSTNDKLYLATRAGLIVTSDLKSFKEIPNDLDLNLTDVVKRNDQLVVTTTDGRMIEYDIKLKRFKTLYTVQQSVFIYDCFIDSKQQIWFTSELGLSYLDAKNQYHLINEENGLPLNNVTGIYEDINNTLWLGSEGKGLFRFSGKQLTYYNKQNGFPSDLVTSIVQLPDGTFCYGTYDNGLVCKQDQQFVTRDLPNNTVWAITNDRIGNLWVATSNALYKTKEGKLLEQFQNDEKAACFFQENNGSILCGGSFGLLRISNGKARLISNGEGLSQVGTIRQITQFKGRLLCAADGGVFEFKKGAFIRFLQFRESSNSIHTDQENNLWIGTENGLFWSDGTTTKRIFLASQPASNLIYFLNSRGNRLLVGTNNGLYLLTDLALKERVFVRYFGKKKA